MAKMIDSSHLHLNVKALWKIGIKEPTKRALPCYAVIISPDGSLQEFKIANLPIQSTKKSLQDIGFGS